MTRLQPTNRRTVLKTIAATAFGGGVASATADGREDSSFSCGIDPSNVVEIVATHGREGEHEFTLSTDEIPSGWTTFEFANVTERTHFAYLSRVPHAAIDEAEQQGEDLLDFYIEHVTRPFQWLMDTQVPGKEPDPEDRFSTDVLFPEWFADVLPSGGPGMTSGHRVSTTTVELDPGEYIVECYVKNENNDFHSSRGMIESLTVTDTQNWAEYETLLGRPPQRGTLDVSNAEFDRHTIASEPNPSLDLSVSSDRIDFTDTVDVGRHTVRVEFEDQRIYEHDLGHDVHLIRFDEETTVEDVNAWTNWMDPAQLVSDGDEPGTFVGGIETILSPGLLDGSETETAYVHVDLVPGDYAWVSEVPDPNGKGLLKEFSVPFGTTAGGR